MARDFISPIKGKRCSLSEVLYRLDWIEILREAIEMRRSSWGDRPVVEWRNASDEVCFALLRALEKAGVDVYATIIVWKKGTKKKSGV